MHIIYIYISLLLLSLLLLLLLFIKCRRASGRARLNGCRGLLLLYYYYYNYWIVCSLLLTNTNILILSYDHTMNTNLMLGSASPSPRMHFDVFWLRWVNIRGLYIVRFLFVIWKKTHILFCWLLYCLLFNLSGRARLPGCAGLASMRQARRAFVAPSVIGISYS